MLASHALTVIYKLAPGDLLIVYSFELWVTNGRFFTKFNKSGNYEGNILLQ